MAEDERIDAFASRTAHQLGEAVALLRGNVAALEARSLDASSTRAVDGLRASAQRTQRVGDDLLDLVAAGRRPPAAATTDLGQALRAAREQLAEDLRRSGTTVTSDPLPLVHADASSASRLMVHALRAALAAGARRIEVAAQADGAFVRLEIRDDGAPHEAAGFEALGPPRGRGALVGAGVSLTICRRIVEHDDGTIELAREGATTILRLSLPAADERDRPVRVLLTDDVPELRSLLRRDLEAGGGVVIVGEAADGATTLRLAAEREPEVVVLDLELFDLGPEELIGGVRRAAPGAAIITYSGHDPQLVAGSAASAIALHVPKTTDLSAVGRAVREVGSRTRAG